jgi:hypothetical protein
MTLEQFTRKVRRRCQQPLCLSEEEIRHLYWEDESPWTVAEYNDWRHSELTEMMSEAVS